MSAQGSRRWRVALIICLVLATLFTAYRLTLHFILQAKLNAIRQQGYPVTLAELDKWYPELQPDQNAALAYGKAFSKYQEWDRIRVKGLPLVGDAKLPARDQALGPDVLKLTEDYLKDNEDALQALHEASTMIQARYVVSFKEGLYTPLLHLPKLRSGARLLALEAIVAAENGQPERAMKSLTACLAMSRSLAEEPAMLSQLTRGTITDTALKALERVLTRTRADRSSLETLVPMLPNEDVPRSVPLALIGERCYVIDMFDRLRSGRIPANDLKQLLAEDVCSSLPIPRVLYPVYRFAGFLEIDELHSLQILQIYIHASELPMDQSSQARLYADGLLDNCFSDWWYHFTVNFVGSVRGVPRSDMRRVAQSRIVRTAIAIEQCRLAQQSMPDSLDEAVPAFLRTVPLDPFTGQQLHFKKLAKGYVIYSVGQDGKDDDADKLKDIPFTVER